MLTYISDERMYQAGLLKIAMRMRTDKGKSFDQILAEVTRSLRLEPSGFRTYVQTNMGVLIAAAKKQT